MDILIMYALMIIDLTWTLMHHEDAGELNPMFARLLLDKEVMFVYIKLIINTLAAFIVIYLRPKRRILSIMLSLFGILVYGTVVYLHWFVDQANKHADELQANWLWGVMQIN